VKISDLKKYPKLYAVIQLNSSNHNLFNGETDSVQRFTWASTHEGYEFWENLYCAEDESDTEFKEAKDMHPELFETP
jgi:hypothetical protein